MYKNQLQELAQRSCFNLPSYSCIREGPDHAPRFKATVNFNGDTFESPCFCTTLRQAEHAAAEVALHALSKRGPSRSLAARVLDETGVYKNLLQETAHRAGLNLPVYTTIRSGPGHTPIFMCTVELAGMSFTGDPAKTKKQAQKNAAMAAWSALKQLPYLGTCSSLSSQLETERNEEQEQVTVARALAKLHSPDGSKPAQQNDHQSGRRKSVPVWREANLANSTPFYSVMPCQGWVHSNFFPEIAMYHTWPQENSPSQQRHFLTLPSASPNDPRNSPYMRPLVPSAQGQYFPVMEQNLLSPMPGYVEAPPMYFPVYSSDPSGGSRSQVSIQEIHEEKSALGETEWFTSGLSDSDGCPSNHKDDVLSRTLDYKIEVSDLPLPTDNSSEPKALESHDKHITFTQGTFDIPPGGKTSCSSPFQPVTDLSPSSVVCDPSSSDNMHRTPHHQVKRDKCEWMNAELRHRHPSPGHLSFLAHNTGIYDTAHSASIILHPPDTSSLGLLQGFRPPHRAVFSTARASVPLCRTGIRPGDFRPRGLSMAPPVTVRTATPVCSARPGGDNPIPTGLSSNVPAVHIRTVQPVCSAPAGRTSTSVQRRTQKPEGISTAASEFGKLQI